MVSAKTEVHVHVQILVARLGKRLPPSWDQGNLHDSEDIHIERGGMEIP